MASGSERHGIAKMRNVIAERAALALDRCYPGAHRDKRIARDFSVSVRMAQHLRAGEHWTLDRLAQASAIFGAAFDAALVPTPATQHAVEMDEIAVRLAELEAWREAMDHGEAAGLAPDACGTPVKAGDRDHLAQAARLDRGGDPVDGRDNAAPGQGGAAGRRARAA